MDKYKDEIPKLSTGKAFPSQDEDEKILENDLFENAFDPWNWVANEKQYKGTWDHEYALKTIAAYTRQKQAEMAQEIRQEIIALKNYLESVLARLTM